MSVSSDVSSSVMQDLGSPKNESLASDDVGSTDDSAPNWYLGAPDSSFLAAGNALAVTEASSSTSDDAKTTVLVDSDWLLGAPDTSIQPIIGDVGPVQASSPGGQNRRNSTDWLLGQADSNDGSSLDCFLPQSQINGDDSFPLDTQGTLTPANPDRKVVVEPIEGFEDSRPPLSLNIDMPERGGSSSDEPTSALLSALDSGLVDNPAFDSLTRDLLGNEGQEIADDLDEVSRVASQILRESVQEEQMNYDLILPLTDPLDEQETENADSEKEKGNEIENVMTLEDLETEVRSPAESQTSMSPGGTKRPSRHSERRKEKEFQRQVEKVRIRNAEEEKAYLEELERKKKGLDDVFAVDADPEPEHSPKADAWGTVTPGNSPGNSRSPSPNGEKGGRKKKEKRMAKCSARGRGGRRGGGGRKSTKKSEDRSRSKTKEVEPSSLVKEEIREREASESAESKKNYSVKVISGADEKSGEGQEVKEEEGKPLKLSIKLAPKEKEEEKPLSTLASSIAALKEAKSGYESTDSTLTPKPGRPKTETDLVTWQPKDVVVKIERLTPEKFEELSGEREPHLYTYPYVYPYDRTDGVESVKRNRSPSVAESTAEAMLMSKLGQTAHGSPKKEKGLISDIERSAKEKMMSRKEFQETLSKAEDESKLYNIRAAPVVQKKRKKSEIVNVQKLIKERSLPKAKVESNQGERCFSCQKRMADPDDSDEETELGSRSAYCSMACVETQVDKAHQVYSSEDHVMVIEKGSGRVLSDRNAPPLSELEAWLKANPTFCPLLPNKPKKTVERTEADSTSNEMYRSLKTPPPDSIRLNVRKTLLSSLLQRSKEVDDILLAENEVRDLAIRIEEELYKRSNGQTLGLYKHWFKAFLINIRSPQNKGLFRRVLIGELTPEVLTALPTEQLAAPRFAQWKTTGDSGFPGLASASLTNSPSKQTEEAKAPEKVETIVLTEATKKETETKPTVAVAKEEPPKSKTGLKLPPAPIKAERKVVGIESSLSSILELLAKDTTRQHKSHLFDLNCKICTGQIKPEEPLKKERKEKRPAKDENGANSAKRQRRLADEQRERLKKVSSGKTPHSAIATPKIIDNDVDDDYEPMDTAFDNESPPMTYDTDVPIFRPTPPPDPTKTEVWNGSISMGEKVKFVSAAYPLVGAESAVRDLRAEIPDQLKIVGRIPPGVVWGYVKELKETQTKEYLLLRFEPPKDGPNKTGYEELYKNMRLKRRFSVVGGLNQELIKDFYIFPLGVSEDLPEPALPLDCSDFLPNRKDNFLMAVVVRHKRPASFFADQEKSSFSPSGEGVTTRMEELPPRKGPCTPPLSEKPPTPLIPHSPTQVPYERSEQTLDEKENERMRDVIYGGVGLPGHPTHGGRDSEEPELDTSDRPVRFMSMDEPDSGLPASDFEDFVRPDVRGLLSVIKTYQNPSAVATKVQEFLDSSGMILSTAEENLVLEALNDIVEQEKKRLMPEQSKREEELRKPRTPTPSPSPSPPPISISEIVKRGLERSPTPEPQQLESVSEIVRRGLTRSPTPPPESITDIVKAAVQERLGSGETWRSEQQSLDRAGSSLIGPPIGMGHRPRPPDPAVDPRGFERWMNTYGAASGFQGPPVWGKTAWEKPPPKFSAGQVWGSVNAPQPLIAELAPRKDRSGEREERFRVSPPRDTRERYRDHDRPETSSESPLPAEAARGPIDLEVPLMPPLPLTDELLPPPPPPPENLAEPGPSEGGTFGAYPRNDGRPFEAPPKWVNQGYPVQPGYHGHGSPYPSPARGKLKSLMDMEIEEGEISSPQDDLRNKREGWPEKRGPKGKGKYRRTEDREEEEFDVDPYSLEDMDIEEKQVVWGDEWIGDAPLPSRLGGRPPPPKPPMPGLRPKASWDSQEMDEGSNRPTPRFAPGPPRHGGPFPIHGPPIEPPMPPVHGSPMESGPYGWAPRPGERGPRMDRPMVNYEDVDFGPMGPREEEMQHFGPRGPPPPWAYGPRPFMGGEEFGAPFGFEPRFRGPRPMGRFPPPMHEGW